MSDAEWTLLAAMLSACVLFTSGALLGKRLANRKPRAPVDRDVMRRLGARLN